MQTNAHSDVRAVEDGLIIQISSGSILETSCWSATGTAPSLIMLSICMRSNKLMMIGFSRETIEYDSEMLAEI